MTDTHTTAPHIESDPESLRVLVREGLHEAGWYARADLEPRHVDAITALVLDLVAEHQPTTSTTMPPPAPPATSSSSEVAATQTGPEDVPVLVVPQEALGREEIAQVVHEGGWNWCANGREEWRWSKAMPREQKVAYAKADAVLRHLRVAASALSHAAARSTSPDSPTRGTTPVGTDRRDG